MKEYLLKLVEYKENQKCEDADIIIVAHGVVSRAADDLQLACYAIRE